MGKFLSKDGLSYFWRSMRTKFDDCITRIFWDSNTETYMYDTMGQHDNDFPIQAVDSSDTKPGLMTPEDKKYIRAITRLGLLGEVKFEYKANNNGKLNLVEYGRRVTHSYDNFLNPDTVTITDQEVPVATPELDGIMSAKDKQTLDDIASFSKATMTPYASHPFVFSYCDLMDINIVMTVDNKNLWCVTVLLNDTEDQTYIATYNGQVLERKPYRYSYPNTPQGDITTWFISLPKTAAKGSCTIGVS